MAFVQNKTFDEIRVGDTASVQRTLGARDVRAWGAAFGDVAPLAESANTAWHGRNYHGNLHLSRRVGPAWPRVVGPLDHSARQGASTDRCCSDLEDSGEGETS